MKKLLFVLYIGIIAITGCSDKGVEDGDYLVNEPVFMPADKFRSSVKCTSQAVPISNYGKMCFYQGYMYISETEKGIHIIDNRNPSHPRNAGFVELLGNADLAIRNGKLYADSFIDLLWFDISNPVKPQQEGRLENVFKDALPEGDNEYAYDSRYCYGYDGREGVIVGWKLKARSQAYMQEKGAWPTWRGGIGGGIRGDFLGISLAYNKSGSSVGVNGSMSRFALYEGYLYSVINNYMNIIDLNGDKPVKAAEDIPVGIVETIFSYRDNMFIGTPSGMMIYSVADPLKPEYMSSVWHAWGCDPVVVEDDIAYITIHSGSACGQTNDDLIIYDVSNVKSPRHLVTYAMTNPKGLGIDSGTLFVCDDGLKIFNAKDPQTIMANELAHYTGMDGFDVIPFDNVLMMIADDGFYQYDYSDLTKIRRLSKLPIVKK